MSIFYKLANGFRRIVNLVWKQSGQYYKITSVTIDHKWYIPGEDFDNYPNLTVRESTMTDKPDERLLSEGWICDGYDRYNGTYGYHKSVDIRSVIKSICIRFVKMTDERDEIEFGFDTEFMSGTYHYPVPEELMEEVARALFDSRTLPYDFNGHEIQGLLRKKIIHRFKDKILDDEYCALSEFKEKHQKALLEAIDSNLSDKEQRYKFADVSKEVEKTSPAQDNFDSSRFYKVTRMNFELAYEKAGIELKRRN